MNQIGHAKVCDEARAGKPYSGKLYVRFDEGSGGHTRSYSTFLGVKESLHFAVLGA